MKKSNKVFRFFLSNWILILIVLFGFIIRLLPFTTAFYWDEAIYLQNAEVIYSGVDNYSELDFRPPLLSVIIAGSYLIYHSFFTAKIIVALLSALSITGVYLLADKAFGKRIALIASFVVAFLPFAIINSRLIMTDNPSIFFICLSFYFFMLFLEKEKRYLLALSAFFTALSILMRFTHIIMIPIIIIGYTYHMRRSLAESFSAYLKCISFYILFVFAFMLPYFLWAQVKLGFFLYPFLMGQQIISWSTPEGLFFYFQNIGEAFPLVLFLVLAYGMFHYFNNRKKENDYFIIFLIWLIISFSYLVSVSHKEVRYLTQITAPLAILFAYSLDKFAIAFRNKRLVIASLAIILLMSLAFNLLNYGPPETDELKDWLIKDYKTDSIIAAEYIKQNLPSGYVVYSNFDYPVIALYSGKKIELIQSSFPDNAKPSFLLVYPVENWIKLNMSEVEEKYSSVKNISSIRIYRYDR